MRTRRLLPLWLLIAFPAVVAAQQPKKAVAVLRFDNNTGDAHYEHLGRALASMMISDLSVVEEIQLIERERIEDLLNELKLQQSGYVDPESAQTVGIMIGAQYVVTGAFTTVDPEMRLDTRVAKVETSEIVKTAEVRGMKDDLFDLQQALADQLVEGLGVILTEEDRARLRAQQEANRIDNVATALAFSSALCLLDGGYYAEAFDRIQEVKRAAPGSRIVQVTMDHLMGRVEDEAKNRLTNQAGRALGNLLGRNPAPAPTRRPAPSC